MAIRIREIRVLFVAGFALSCAGAEDEVPGNPWTIEVLQTAWCDDPDACWRMFRVSDSGAASVEDREGSVTLDEAFGRELRGRWADFALSLEDGDCAPGLVFDLAEQLSVTVERRDRTLVIADAWGCAGYGPDGGVDRRLKDLIVETAEPAQQELACPPWVAYSAPFGPSEIVESTPRFICFW